MRPRIWVTLIALVIIRGLTVIPPLSAAGFQDVSSPPANSATERSGLDSLDPETQSLLRLTMTADKTLGLSGEQTTILYRPSGKSAVQSTQTVIRDGDRGYRCEYHSPNGIAGDLLISRDGTSWHYMPSKKLIKIGSPRGRHLMTMIGPALRAVRQGKAQVHTVGDDTVAGHATKVLQFTGVGQSASGLIKLWIDPVTGAQLKTEVYGAGGSLQSTSYFTQVNYSPALSLGTFDPPTVPPDTKTEFEQRDKQLSSLPTDAEAGFHVMKPGYLPQGYAFQSASIFQVSGRNAVSLRYANGLTLLSVFEAPANPSSSTPKKLQNPRRGMVIVTNAGMRFAAMGTLAESELLNVVNSMK